MQIKTHRRKWPLWVFSTVVLLSTSCVTGGKVIPVVSSAHSASVTQPVVTRIFARSEPGPRPDWVDNTPKSETEFFVSGASSSYAEVVDARGAARENAFNQIVQYYGDIIQRTSITHISTAGLSSETLDPYLVREEEIAHFAQAIVQQVAADKYYTEIYNVDGREEYTVYVLCQMPKAKVESDIRNFAKNISERYTNLFSVPNNLITALKLYADIYAQLQKNPLHRTVAYYDGPTGHVGLFEYCSTQMNALSGSVSFVSIPSWKVPKGETLKANVRLSSALFSAIGSVPCRITISGRNNGAPAVLYTVGPENAFSLEIKTGSFETGSYNVQMELLLNDGLPIALRNPPPSGFSFEVVPPLAYIDFVGGDLTDMEKRTLTQSVQRGIQQNRVPVTLVTPAGSELDTGNHYVFEVTVELLVTGNPSPDYTLYQYGVSLALFHNGKNIQQSETKTITDMARYVIIGAADKFIRENNGFFRQAGVYLQDR